MISVVAQARRAETSVKFGDALWAHDINDKCRRMSTQSIESEDSIDWLCVNSVCGAPCAAPYAHPISALRHCFGSQPRAKVVRIRDIV